MDLLDQIRHRSPCQLLCDFGPYIEVDPRDKKMTTRFNQVRTAIANLDPLAFWPTRRHINSISGRLRMKNVEWFWFRLE